MADQIGSPGAFFADVDGEDGALERFHALVNALDAGVFQCDADLVLVAVNDALLEQTGHERDDLIGQHVSAILDDAGVDRVEAASRASDVDAGVDPATAHLRTADGDGTACEVRLGPIGEAGRVRGVAGVVTDVPGGDWTAGADGERRPDATNPPVDSGVGHADELLDDVPAVVYRCRNEPGWPMTVVSDGCEAVTGYEAAAVESGAVSWGEDVIHPDSRDRVWEAVQSGIDDGEGFTLQYRIQTADGVTRWVWERGHVVDDPAGAPAELEGIITDATEWKRHERELEQYRALTQSVNDVIVVIDEESTILSVNPAVEDVFGYEPGELEGQSLTELVASEAAESHRQGLRGYLEEGASSIDWEYVELAGRTADGETVPVEVSFSESEFGGEQYFTGVIRDITERKERERKLERRRMRLAALAHLNDVVHDVTEAVVERSTREEIEQAACERLVASDSYAFAWVADVDPETREVTPRTEVGVEGYLEAVPLSADPEEAVGQGPTGRAVRTKEMQVSTDVFDDPDFEPWREYAEAYGFRSFTAIPVVHEGTLYGVMGVYSERHGAFTDEEGDVLGQIGEIIGHGIAAVERKQALMGDEMIELDFHLEDVFSELDVEASTTDRISFERIVPIGGDEHLVYGSATEDDLPALETLVDALPYWDGLRIVSEEGDPVNYELTVTESRILASVASRGGDVKEAYIEGGDYRITVQVPPSVEVRAIADVVTDVYPAVELRAQRQVTREADGTARVAAAFQDELTERQRHVVQSAYFSGYFEWPRESSGEEIAESLDIAPATFSQHLRTAENRIFGALFDDARAPSRRER